MKTGRIFATTALLLACVILPGCDMGGNDDATNVPDSGGIFSRNRGGDSPATDQPAIADSYSILLKAFTGADHVQAATYYKTQTEAQTRWSGLFISNDEDHSELYWGRYPTLDAAADNLQAAKAYRAAGTGIEVFPQALVVPLPGSTVGPPQWNLLNATGKYSVVVAVFYDVPEANYYGRKEHALTYCRQLREQGNEAYYHHGPSQSTVTVGTFDDRSVRRVQDDEVERLQIRDPRIQRIIDEFEFLAVNGRAEKRVVSDLATNTVKRITVPPYPVRIPRQQED